MKITKAVVPVAGFGTRFLPVTKALPKEMLPVVDKPVVQYVVEELVASGITEIIFVTGQNKRAIEDHFDYHPELEAWLEKGGKEKALSQIREIAGLANFIYIRQKGPYGNGTPVLNAQHLIGDEPFVVVWGDDIFQSTGKPRVAQLLETFAKYTDPIVTAVEIDDEGTKKYAVVEGVEIEPTIYQVKKMMEKPGPSATESRLGVVGGYVLTPDIFEVLKNTPIRDGELWLPDAIANLGVERPLYAKKVEATYFDIGLKIGWYEANLSFGLQNLEIKKELEAVLKKTYEKISKTKKNF